MPAMGGAPLWYAWQGTIRDGRAEILQADALRLTDIYRRRSACGAVADVDRVIRIFDALCCWPRRSVI